MNAPSTPKPSLRAKDAPDLGSFLAETFPDLIEDAFRALITSLVLVP